MIRLTLSTIPKLDIPKIITTQQLSVAKAMIPLMPERSLVTKALTMEILTLPINTRKATATTLFMATKTAM